MTRDLTKTNEMFQRALKTIPYGVNSNFRYWGDKDTIVVARGDGGVMWDQDENRYIDYRLAFGPVILGHSYPPVNEAVAKALKDQGKPTLVVEAGDIDLGDWDDQTFGAITAQLAYG